MMCMIDDADYSEFTNVKMVIARKPHRCGECNCIIPTRYRYEYASGKTEEFWVSKTCMACIEDRKWLMEHCNGYLYGAVAEDLTEHYHDGVTDPQLVTAHHSIRARIDANTKPLGVPA